MTLSKAGADRRLERLERVLAGRRARLEATLARRERRVYSEPVGGLQRYGYPVALLLVVTALLPTMIGFGWRRRRKRLLRAAKNGVTPSGLRRRIASLRSTGSH